MEESPISDEASGHREKLGSSTSELLNLDSWADPLESNTEKSATVGDLEGTVLG